MYLYICRTISSCTPLPPIFVLIFLPLFVINNKKASLPCVLRMPQPDQGSTPSGGQTHTHGWLACMRQMSGFRAWASSDRWNRTAAATKSALRAACSRKGKARPGKNTEQPTQTSVTCKVHTPAPPVPLQAQDNGIPIPC